MNRWLQRYFIPSQTNDFKPHILQKTAVVLMSILVLLSFALTNLQALLWINSDWLVGSVLPSVVVDLTNESRAEQHLGQLRRNTTLDEAARLKAEDMAAKGYFAHYAPDGTTPWYWFGVAGYSFTNAGENLAVHFTDSDEVVDAWLRSPAHRDNIMSQNFTEIGVGTARGTYDGYDTVFVVQLFGTPVAAAAVTTPEPASVPVASDVPAAAVASESIVLEPIVEPTSDTVVVAETEIAPEAQAEVVTESVPAAPIDLADVEVAKENNESVVYVSDTISTTETVAGVVSDIAELVPDHSNSGSTMARLATQPQRILNIIYAIVASFVLLSLFASILIEIRKQHPVQIAYGTALLALMAVLTYVHILVTEGALIV